MLSYRHAWHAGNHADVLKHLVLVELLSYLTAADRRLWYIDTHAGAGWYALARPPADVHGEWRSGIGRLWNVRNLPPCARRYVDLVRSFNDDGRLCVYPGSPVIAHALLSAEDRLWLSELHPADHAALVESFRGRAASNVRIIRSDGWRELTAKLPPAPRRALTMIDPSYETSRDYAQLVESLSAALKRFPTGVYATWYPLIRRRRARALPDELRALGAGRWLAVQLEVGREDGEAAGLYGSGMFVINPPHTLPATLEATMPRVTGLLARDDGARYRLDYRMP